VGLEVYTAKWRKIENSAVVGNCYFVEKRSGI
jgi:hypothetical protein